MSEERGVTKFLMDRLRVIRHKSGIAQVIRTAKRLRDNGEALGEWGAWLAFDEVLEGIFSHVGEHPRAPYPRNRRGQYEGPAVVSGPMEDLANLLVTVYAPAPYILPPFDPDDLIPAAQKLEGLGRNWGNGEAVEAFVNIAYVLRMVAAAYQQPRLNRTGRFLCLACHREAEEGMYYCRHHSPGTDAAGHMAAKRRGLADHPSFGFGRLRPEKAPFRIGEYGLPTDGGRDGFNALSAALWEGAWDPEMIPGALCFGGSGADQVGAVARSATGWSGFVDQCKDQLGIAADTEALEEVISLLDLYCLNAGDTLRGTPLRTPASPIQQPTKRGRKRDPDLRQNVLEGLQAGKKQREIAVELGKKRQHIHQINKELEREGLI